MEPSGGSSQDPSENTDDVVDAERTVAGKEMTPDEMTAYRVLVGAANVRRAKIAADLVRQGKAVPAPIMVAYAPIIQMIDDIAKGGYTYVRLLQSIHDRAKTKSKSTVNKSGNYTIRSVKAFIDGALGSRGAALLKPY